MRKPFGRPVLPSVLLFFFSALTQVLIAEPNQPKNPIEETKISLVTILPGRALYSSFGHTAIRVFNAGESVDLLYNYGLSARPFDLRFALGMLIGKMDFMVAALKTDETLRFYSGVENRTIMEQRLNLEPNQTKALTAELAHDVRPENQVYSYRYFTDNCTTRVWKLLAPYIVDLPVKESSKRISTLRSSIKETLGENDWLRSSLDLLLGPQADRPITSGAPLFLPLQLRNTMGNTRIMKKSSPESFVLHTTVLYEARKQEYPCVQISPIMLSALVLMLSLALFLLPSSSFALLFDIFLFGLASLAGLAILSFWLLAGYREVGFNLNLLWASPLSLIALIGLRRKPTCRGWLVMFQIVAASAGLVAIAGGLGIQDLPPELRILAVAIALRCISRRWLIDRGRANRGGITRELFPTLNNSSIHSQPRAM